MRMPARCVAEDRNVERHTQDQKLGEVEQGGEIKALIPTQAVNGAGNEQGHNPEEKELIGDPGTESRRLPKHRITDKYQLTRGVNSYGGGSIEPDPPGCMPGSIAGIDHGEKRRQPKDELQKVGKKLPLSPGGKKGEHKSMGQKRQQCSYQQSTTI